MRQSNRPIRSIALLVCLSGWATLAGADQDPTRSLIHGLESGYEDERVDAARKLAALGAAAQPAVPALTHALTDRSDVVRELAAEALGAIGPPALPAARALIQCADDLNPSGSMTIQRCQEALAKLGPQVVPVMLRSVLDVLRVREGPNVPNAERGELAAWDRAAFRRGQLDPVYEALGVAALVPLRRALKSSRPDLRTEAASALSSIGPAARDALPDLRSALGRTRDPEMRKTIEEAIAAIEKR